jgi:hypothetical protein
MVFETGGTVVPYSDTLWSIRTSHAVNHMRDKILKKFPDASFQEEKTTARAVKA